jgi:hypothetical protein
VHYTHYLYVGELRRDSSVATYDPPTYRPRSYKEIFESFSHGLKFTIEEPTEGVLQFLDLKIIAKEKEGTYWRYSQRSEKALLSQCSSHSKIVKDGNIKNQLLTAVEQSV